MKSYEILWNPMKSKSYETLWNPMKSYESYDFLNNSYEGQWPWNPMKSYEMLGNPGRSYEILPLLLWFFEYIQRNAEEFLRISMIS